MVTRDPLGVMPWRLCAMSMVDVVSTETSESDCDIESRPRNQIAGAGVGMRAHEHSDRQTCRLYAQSAFEIDLEIGMLGGRGDDDLCKEETKVLLW